MKRDINNRVIGGVCSGIAKHFNVDTALVRVGFVAAFLFWGIGPLIYLLMWLIVPAEEKIEE